MALIMKLSTLLLVQILTMSMQEVWILYVKPSNTSSSICSDQPCLTLDQYMENASTYFTAGSTFVFLPGNHTLQSNLSLSDISNVTLKGTIGQYSATIICTIEYVLVCDNVSSLSIEWLTFDLTKELVPYRALIIKIYNSKEVIISDCRFKGSGNVRQTRVRALDVSHSAVAVVRSLFVGSTGFYNGGAVSARFSSLAVSNCAFIGNKAGSSGGAISVNFDSSITLTMHNYFMDNRADYMGGAIHCASCTIVIAGNNSFERNAILYPSDSKGGAICISYGQIITSGTMAFSNNEAKEGGAIYIDEDSNALLSGESIIISHNEAEIGGGMSIRSSTMKINSLVAEFHGNVAKKLGGGLSIRYDELTVRQHKIEVSATFSNNSAECGSAAHVENEGNVVFVNANIADNHGSALCLYRSYVDFSGTTNISRNAGGGISSEASTITFRGTTRFFDNAAEMGGAINSIQGEIVFNDTALFTHNRATSGGGAIHASGSRIILNCRAEFFTNSAFNGGAIYLSGATLVFTCLTVLRTSENHAAAYGGAIYHEDKPTSEQCRFRFDNDLHNSSRFLPLPLCFVESEDLKCDGRIQSHHDSAERDGYFLFGGLLNKCRQTRKYQLYTLYERLLWGDLITVEKPTGEENGTVKNITSGATELYVCKSGKRIQDSISVEIFRGQKFTVPLLALAQVDSQVSTQVISVTHTSRVKVSQKTQTLPEGCSDLTYNLYSIETRDELILYPDGPCRDSGLARVVVSVTFLPCPGGFTQSGEVCICEERMQVFE